MSILTGREILRLAKEQRSGERIVLQPLDESKIGSNSADVRLGDSLLYYAVDQEVIQFRGGVAFKELQKQPIDFDNPPPTISVTIPDEGFALEPGRVYLATTIEYTETHGLVPILFGRSSTGRYGLQVHCTAGFGDIGYRGHYGLQLSCIQPVIVKKGMKIAQIAYFDVRGETRDYDGRYQDSAAEPIASKFHEPEKCDVERGEGEEAYRCSE